MVTHEELLEHLVVLAAAGYPTPCVQHPAAGWIDNARVGWFANEREQRDAARLCERCPGLAPCREYGLAHPGELGVYGGLTERERAGGRVVS